MAPRIPPCQPRTGMRTGHIPPTRPSRGTARSPALHGVLPCTEPRLLGFLPCTEPCPLGFLPCTDSCPSRRARRDPRDEVPARAAGSPRPAPPPGSTHRPVPSLLRGSAPPRGPRRGRPYQEEVLAPLVGQPAPPGQRHGAGRPRGSSEAGGPGRALLFSRAEPPSPLPTPHPPPWLPAAGA